MSKNTPNELSNTKDDFAEVLSVKDSKNNFYLVTDLALDEAVGDDNISEQVFGTRHYAELYGSMAKHFSEADIIAEEVLATEEYSELYQWVAKGLFVEAIENKPDLLQNLIKRDLVRKE